MDIFNSWLINKYIAHRGLHNEISPENSLSAFQNAVDQGYTIELDVHQIKDGTIVVFHDDTLNRMTKKDGYTNQIKDVRELKKLKLQDTQESIPTLQEVFDLVNGQVPILIEVKDNNSRYNPANTFEKALYDLIKKYKGEVAVMSFNPYILKWFKIHAPEVLRGQLAGFFKGEKLKFIVKFVLKRMLLNKKVSDPNFIAYCYKDLPNRFVRRFEHLPILAWAVPSQSEYMKVVPHCDNIIFENFEPRI